MACVGLAGDLLSFYKLPSSPIIFRIIIELVLLSF